MSETPNCQNCGACCVGDPGVNCWANVEEHELPRLYKAGVRSYDIYTIPPIDFWDESTDAICTHKVEQTDGPLAGRKLMVCVFLRGSVGGAVSCAIYPNRPLVCQEYRPGSEGCKTRQGEVFNVVRTGR